MKNKWIILRGLGRGRGHWGVFLNQVQEAFPDDRFYFLDLPGNGFLNKEKSPLTVPGYVPSLEDQLKHTDFFDHPGSTFGVGLSLGGMILTEWARQYPKRFDKIALINTSSCNFSYPWQRLSILVFLGAFKQAVTTDIEQFELNSLLVTTNLNLDQIKNQFKENYWANVNFTKEYPISKWNVKRQLIAAAHYFFPSKPPVPTVLINGAKDRFVSPVCTENIQAKWKCPIVAHPNAGHDIAFEDSEWLIKKLREHLLQ